MNARRLLWPAAGVAAAALVAGVALARMDDGTTASAAANEHPEAIARVERRDLVERETLDGTLGFADLRSLPAARPGTLTWLPMEGSVVHRGARLYEVDGRSSYLLYGSKPAWRALRTGVEDGADVRQLERNLVAMGYDPDGDIEVDEQFDSATAAAVKRWEKARGAKQDGVVELGEVVFLPGARRVGAHKLPLGAPLQPGSEVMETSSTRRIVTVNLAATQQGLVRRGDRVQVEYPGGRVVTGRVADVGKVAQTTQTESGEDGDPYIVVTIVVERSAGGLDQTPVDVHVARETRKNVLTVPVAALLARAGGGYAVEVQSSTGKRLVAVTTGSFADGYVEVTGRGLRAGMNVAVPR